MKDYNSRPVVVPSDGSMQKEAILGGAFSAGRSFLGRTLGRALAGRSGRERVHKGLYEKIITGGRGSQNLTPTRISRLAKLEKANRIPTGGFKGMSATRASRIGRSANLRANATSYSDYGSEVRRNLTRKAVKGSIYGGGLYAINEATDFVGTKRDPYESQHTYNKHVQDNIVSGNIDPHSVGSGTLRSIMSKRASIDKEALVGGLLNAGMAALTFPAQHEENRKKVQLRKRLPLRPRSMKGNIQTF